MLHIRPIGIREAAKLVFPKPLLPVSRRAFEGSHGAGYVKFDKSLVKESCFGSGGGMRAFSSFFIEAPLKHSCMAPLGDSSNIFIASESTPVSFIIDLASCQQFTLKSVRGFKFVKKFPSFVQ